MEGQTKRLVNLLTALATIEEVLLDVVAHSEERAARGVGRGVNAIGASNPTGKSACGRSMPSKPSEGMVNRKVLATQIIPFAT